MPVYIINGKEYGVKTGQEIHDINSSWPDQQFLTINGATINLHTIKSRDEYNKRSLNLEIISEKNSHNITIPEIYEVISFRIKNREATNLEKALVFQLKYQELARAEAKAEGIDDKSIKEMSCLTEQQILGYERFLDLRKTFPWAYADAKEIEADKKRENYWLIGANAYFRERCRENLQDIQQKRWNDYLNISPNYPVNQTELSTDLLLQEKTTKAKSALKDSRKDERTDRLLAAAQKKSEINKAKERTHVQQISDNHDRI